MQAKVRRDTRKLARLQKIRRRKCGFRRANRIRLEEIRRFIARVMVE